jgi:dTDP-4-amino-4,6-dideoxygalactose transaminase
LLPVHLYGQLANMPALRAISEKHDLALIEDAAQAHGAVSGDEAAGRAGTVACFSFYPGKNLGAYGDGGMLTTNDRSLAERLRRLRNYGSARKYHHQEVGLNSRLDSLQAAVLRVKLRRLAADNARRREIAARYDAALADLPLTLTRFGGIPVYHLYVVRSPNRDRLLATLNAAGIGAAIHYPKAIHQHQAFSAEPLGRGVFPQAERWARECLSLPVFPEMSDAQVDQVADALRAGLADAAA